MTSTQMIRQNDIKRKIKEVHDDTTYSEKGLNDCRNCQNMSCRVENYEKPVEGCLGYIHHTK